MDSVTHGAVYDDALGDDLRDHRADQADRDADQRDSEADQAANAAGERDRRAASRDAAAAERHRSLLTGTGWCAADWSEPDDTGRRPSSGVSVHAEADRDDRRRVLAEAAHLGFDELLDRLDSCYARWQAVRRELDVMAEDRAAAADDRRLASDERDDARHARRSGATDRARGAADRNERRVQHGRRPRHLEPAVLRRALSYIDDHARDDIGVEDIALYAQISPRGLQQTFRRYRDCTPLEHLRRVRMSRAHEALQAADPSLGDTVALISACWRFSNPGRFATQYRVHYGYSPSTTLRG